MQEYIRGKRGFHDGVCRTKEQNKTSVCTPLAEEVTAYLAGATINATNVHIGKGDITSNRQYGGNFFTFLNLVPRRLLF